ncbi:MAG TPA: hypothetical protein VFA54_10005 [Bryobacterales bacterium]|jgi:hypothetical protein|nr:hypothetical protein [Bryobacterales bacterium]
MARLPDSAAMAELRLGDIIDDYCSRCKLLTNHSIVSILNGEPAKVYCRTCFFEHNYHHGKGAEKKRSTSRKSKLFDQVLSSITGNPASAGPKESEESPPNEKPKTR